MKACFKKAEALFARKGARILAGACLNHAAKHLCGLSIRDLPDLPCGMNFRDHWQETWEAEGLTEASFAEAIAQAAECVREILAEDGLEDLAREAEDAADGKFGSRYA